MNNFGGFSLVRKSSSFFLKTIDKWFFIYYNIKVAGVAQSVVQLIRNQQVVCSSHITSSISSAIAGDFLFHESKLIRNLPIRAMLHQVVCSSRITSSRKKSNAICVRLFSVMIALWKVVSLDMLRIVMIWLRQS